MKKILTWLKLKLTEWWVRLKKLIVGILIAIGLIAGPILFAGELNLSWTNPVERIDGTVFDAATEQAAIKIYCNGDVPPNHTFISAGDATSLSEIVPPGDYECYATAVDTDGQESFASNTITKTVEKALPNPPVLTE